MKPLRTLGNLAEIIYRTLGKRLSAAPFGEHGLVYELPDALVETLDDLTEDAPTPVAAAGDEVEADAEEADAEGQDTALEQRATARADAQTLSLQLQRGHVARERRCTRVEVDYRQLGRG